MLSALADAKVNSFGCMHIARTDFLWCVRVVIVLPATSKGLFQGIIWKIVSTYEPKIMLTNSPA
eukprot:1195082-Prorocentrum_minimum.AAC.9